MGILRVEEVGKRGDNLGNGPVGSEGVWWERRGGWSEELRLSRYGEAVVIGEGERRGR
jgi:hypothetical protein